MHDIGRSCTANAQQAKDPRDHDEKTVRALQFCLAFSYVRRTAPAPNQKPAKEK
jgi:hypothetical protein